MTPTVLKPGPATLSVFKPVDAPVLTYGLTVVPVRDAIDDGVAAAGDEHQRLRHHVTVDESVHPVDC